MTSNLELQIGLKTRELKESVNSLVFFVPKDGWGARRCPWNLCLWPPPGGIIDRGLGKKRIICHALINGECEKKIQKITLKLYNLPENIMKGIYIRPKLKKEIADFCNIIEFSFLIDICLRSFYGAE